MKASNLKNKLILTAITFLSSVCTSAQQQNQVYGTAGYTTGNCSMTRQELWSVANNQANLAFNRHLQAGITSEYRFMMKELALHSFAVSIPVRTGAFGLLYSRQGFAEYNENIMELAFGMPLGDRFAAGLCLSYNRIDVEPSAYSWHSPGFNIGCLYQVNPAFKTAIQIRSYFKKDLTTDKLSIHSAYTLACDYVFSEKITSMAEIYKISSIEPGLRFGMEFEAYDHLFLRGGCQTFPFLLSFGVGYTIRGMIIDIGFGSSDRLGMTPSFSIVYISRK